MKLTKRIIAFALMMTMLLSLVPFAAFNVVAIEGAGAPTDLNYYVKGIDISEWQGSNVDFTKLLNSGCEFVILRIGYSTTLDSYFISNYNKARAAGMPLGVYLYSYSTTYSGAAREASWVISIFEQYDMYFEYPIFIDLEEEAQMALTDSGKESLAAGWCETLVNAGYYPGIYSYGSRFCERLSDATRAKYDLWVPQVASTKETDWQYSYNSINFNAQGYSMWQYSWSNYNYSAGGGYIYQGINSTGLDLDVCYKDYPTIMSTYGWNNCGPGNLLKGKTATISGNGVGAHLGSDQYSYRADITDGKTASDMNWTDDEWFGFYAGAMTEHLNTVNRVGTATISLNGAYSLNKLRAHIYSGGNSGIGDPAVKAYVSLDNGANWVDIKSSFSAAPASGTAYWAEVDLADVKATDVRFEFTIPSGSTFAMIDELEAYGESTTITAEDIANAGVSLADKTKLLNAIASAEGISYKDYGHTTLGQIHDTYIEAILLTRSADSTTEECNALADKLNSLVSNKAVILSVGKSYTTTPPDRDDEWADDGIRLTDGKKGDLSGGSVAYSGWQEETVITVDLGSVMTSDTYTAYMAAGNWGVALPMSNSFVVEVQTSTDGSNFATIGASTKIVHEGGATSYNDEYWGTFSATIEAGRNISARYVRFIITNEECVGHIWLDEVEVSRGESSIAGGVYVTDLNTKVDNGCCNVFTSDFNNGVITDEEGGITWTRNVVAKWDSTLNAYVVTETFDGNGDKGSTTITLDDDEILIAAHSWENEEGIENPVIGSAANVIQLYSARVGDVIELHGVDIANGIVAPGAHVMFSAAGEVQNIEYFHSGVIEATCTENSYCEHCENVLSDPLGHDEGEWITLDDGSEVLKCTRCGIELDNAEGDGNGDGDNTRYVGLRGDINNNDVIDMTDYVLSKRAYFGTYNLSEDEIYRADIDELETGKVTMTDYILLKRAYFGTYTIKNPYIYVIEN